MKKTTLYVPVLKWKAGEYQALSKLSPKVKDSITPLLQLTPPEFDYEKRVPKKDIDQQLENFAERFKKNWARDAFIDFELLGNDYKMADGRQPVEYIFDELAKLRLFPIPVVTLKSSLEFQKSVAGISILQNTGICIKLSLDDAYDVRLTSKIEQILNDCVVTKEDCVLILDLKSPNFDPVNAFAAALSEFISRIPNLDLWSNVIITASSFPRTMGDIKGPLEFVERKEWELFKELKKILSEKRKIIFGDYTISNPEFLRIDMRLVKPAAAIKYTIDDKWLIYKGKNLRKPGGHDQYFDLCKKLCDSNYFKGEEYSAGDKRFHSTANKEEKCGNSTTWVEAGVNHHITKVIDELSNFDES